MSANPHNAGLGFESTGSNRTGSTEGEAKGETIALPTPLHSPSGAQPVRYAPGHEALQALLAFSSLHEQLRQRRARQTRGEQESAEAWELEQFVLDEVLQLVSERALTLTGADGVAIALAEDNAIVCRASAGTIAPEPGAKLDPNSGFSGACLRTGGIVRCDDSETDRRVDLQVCRRLGTRSIVAVPITSSRGVIGLVEAFSAEAYGFNDSDVRSLNLLAELILAALKPEEENRLAEISQRVVSEKSGDAVIERIRNEIATAEPIAEPEIAPQNNNRRLRSALLIALPLLAIGALLAAGIWWNSKHRNAPAPVAAPQQQSQATTPAAGAAADSSSSSPSSNADAKGSMRPLVTGIWHVSSDNSSTVTIETQSEVQYEAHRLSDPERIYVDIHDTSLAPGLFGKTIEVGDPLLARVRIAQPRRGVSRVVLETTGASDFSVSEQSNPYRLVVQIKKAAKPENSAASDLPKADLSQPDLPDSRQASQDLQAAIALKATSPAAGSTAIKSDEPMPAHIAKFRLVLDAGHGGWDLGTVGRKGLMEKDLVLDIVERVGKLVQNRLGAEVIYTRQGDHYLPLEKRTEIANLAQADMFVSVHANYSEDSSARGAETYYTNTYSSVRARTSDSDADTAAPENINWTNVDIREKVQQSRRFAVAVQQALHRALAAQIPGMRNRGVKKASYVVLTGTSMPAVLAEVSFVSSPADEVKLESSNYRQSIAEALYKGIAQYAASNHHVNLASASSKPKGL
ncbi:MAG: N-acetylmuramoyl-L-alanine amidase [Terriglobales bacterium]